LECYLLFLIVSFTGGHMSKLLKVANIEDFETQHVVVVSCDDIAIAIFKVNAQFYAIDDICSHADASLSEGAVNDNCEIICPLHGAHFDLKTGKALSFPAVRPVKTYPVVVKGGFIYVQLPW
jgi:3-phenylpropionate/trans-cinnamate dioxygenase ferredoxin subunit